MKLSQQPSIPSTTATSASSALGKYVTLRKRADGTVRVYFEVPKRLRPPGWLPAIPLPLKDRTGTLTAEEVGRIQKDAASLYAELQGDRDAAIAAAAPPAPITRDFKGLLTVWLASEGVRVKRPATQKGYAYHAQVIVDLASTCGASPETLTRPTAERMLEVYREYPTTRRHLKIVLKMMIDRAIALEWRKDNPVERIKIAVPKPVVLIWEADDVESMAAACLTGGQPAIAAMIRMQWEIGQRVTDARLFRSGVEYEPQEGVFRFYQSKTASYVTIPVSAALRATLDGLGKAEGEYLFTDAPTGRPFDEARLGHEFERIRQTVGETRKLVLRSLRHSCVVQLARAGCTVPEIAAVTGHSLTSAEQILNRYLPRDNEVAWRAQEKRGLVAPGQRSLLGQSKVTPPSIVSPIPA